MPITSPLVKEKEEAIVAKTMAIALPKGKKKLQASTLGDGSDDIKILIQGHTGAGKTLTVSSLLRTTNPDGSPTRVFVASTDIGGQGLRSVKEDLLAKGLGHLMKNLKWFHFRDYETFAAFTSDPACVEIDGKPFWDFDPNVLVWDGLANFQESHVWRYIMDLEPLAKDSTEVRDAGVQAGQAEWGQIRRVTILQTDLFVSLQHLTKGKPLHKLVTVLMDDGKESKLTKETKQGPLIMGAARDYIGPAFDVILTARALQAPMAKVATYSYTCEVGGKAIAKVRGQKLPEEPLRNADFKALWEHLVLVTTQGENL